MPLTASSVFIRERALHVFMSVCFPSLKGRCSPPRGLMRIQGMHTGHGVDRMAESHAL